FFLLEYLSGIFMYKSNNNNRICVYPGCRLSASFGFKGDIFVYCLSHGKLGMIILDIDKCYKDCSKKTFKMKPIRPRYTRPYEPPAKKKYYLIDSETGIKKPWAINCIRKNCHIEASYNVIGDPNPLYCMLHSHNDMVNVVIDKCH